MINTKSDTVLWTTLIDAENAFFSARRKFLLEVRDFDVVIGSALNKKSHRFTALSLIRDLEEIKSRLHIGTLIELASVNHSDLGLAKEVILRIDRSWLIANIESYVVPILEKGDNEPYTRFAELYDELGDKKLLHRHLERCVAHPDEEVREIIEDYSQM